MYENKVAYDTRLILPLSPQLQRDKKNAKNSQINNLSCKAKRYE